MRKLKLYRVVSLAISECLMDGGLSKEFNDFYELVRQYARHTEVANATDEEIKQMIPSSLYVLLRIEEQ